MAKKRILGILVALAVVLAFVAPQVSAGPYMGGYLKRSAVTSNSVLLSVNYQETDASEIPDGKWLGGVASVAGADGLTPSGWIYQSLVALSSDNDVDWAPQAWHGDQLEEYDVRLVGEGDYIAFYERMDIGCGTVYYRLYRYPTFSHFDNDQPLISEFSHSTDDANFLVGRQWHVDRYYKHLQFGVESDSTITNTAWEELNNHPCYHDGSNWRYTEGRVCNGTSSEISWEDGEPYWVGGVTYSGVNTKYTSNDQVCWNYSGQTVGDDEQLWSGSGTVSDVVSQPYICYGPNLKEGSNILCYFGETADFKEALNNIGPNGEDLVEIIWARADWTDGDWWFYNVAQNYSSPAEFTDLQTCRAYMIVVSEDCTWYLP